MLSAQGQFLKIFSPPPGEIPRRGREGIKLHPLGLSKVEARWYFGGDRSAGDGFDFAIPKPNGPKVLFLVSRRFL